MNLYGFVRNNVINLLDYLGLRSPGSVACAGCHGTADGTWGDIAGHGRDVGNCFQLSNWNRPILGDNVWGLRPNENGYQEFLDNDQTSIQLINGLKSFAKRGVKLFIRKNCSSRPTTAPGEVGPGNLEWPINRISWELSDVKITWTGDKYTWTGAFTVSNTFGSNEVNPFGEFNGVDFIVWPVCHSPRDIQMGEWEIEGEGCCPAINNGDFLEDL